MSAHTTESSVPEKYLQCLREWFGHSKFHKSQWKVISSILNDGRDNYMTMKSGYGKSLCYQFPSVYLKTSTIVISPFISLMQDQVQSLRNCKIEACLLGTAEENPDDYKDVIAGMYTIVYMTPECGRADTVLRGVRDRLTLIAVDEAYNINKWGSFRTAYRALKRLRTICPNVPILAISCSATKYVKSDIIETLQLRNPQIINGKLDRPNLELIANESPASEVWSDLGPYLRDPSVSVIIRCPRKYIAEEVYNKIKAEGVICDIYHTNLSLKDRWEAQNNYMSDRKRVIVATASFGTGLDRPDIRLVIHYGFSDDVETYYQQIGMAGRDGKPAKCLLFYQGRYWNRNTYTAIEGEDMQKYVKSTTCRRRFILSQFEEDCSLLNVRSDCCDICRKLACENPILGTKQH